jgi:hypothetical protein
MRKEGREGGREEGREGWRGCHSSRLSPPSLLPVLPAPILPSSPSSLPHVTQPQVVELVAGRIGLAHIRRFELAPTRGEEPGREGGEEEGQGGREHR